MLEVNKTYHLNCIAGMEKMDEESVDLVVTSPPYDDLRTYNDSSKWDQNTFYAVAAQLNRVLKPGGVIMWNVNDATINGSETGSSFRQCLYFHDECGLNTVSPSCCICSSSDNINVFIIALVTS